MVRLGTMVVLLVLAALVAGAGVFAYREFGIGAPATHTWRVEVLPDGAGPWSVDVPRPIMAAIARVDSVSSFLDRLDVVSGDGRFDLNAHELRVSGEGSLALEAKRMTWIKDEAEDFTDWVASGRNMSRVHEAVGPSLEVTWRVDFSGGRGHTCWADAKHVTRVMPGEVVEFPTESRREVPYAQLWQTICA